MRSTLYSGFFHVDHVVARQHGGRTDLSNLALACMHCNRHKGPNIAGSDPRTGEIVRLFDPLVRLSDRRLALRPRVRSRTQAPQAQDMINVRDASAENVLSVRPNGNQERSSRRRNRL
jgi:hypothetical protein